MQYNSATSAQKKFALNVRDGPTVFDLFAGIVKTIFLSIE